MASETNEVLADDEIWTEEELLRRARTYYVPEIALVADEDTQVIRPATYFDPRGCSAIRIRPDGRWEEGWWSPDEPFRPLS